MGKLTRLTGAIDAVLLAKENIDIGHIESAFPDECVCGLCDAVRKEVEQAKREALEEARLQIVMSRQWSPEEGKIIGDIFRKLAEGKE